MNKSADLSDFRLGFIGSGNMAQAIINGLIQSGFPAQHLHICSPNAESKDWIQSLEVAQANDDLSSLVQHCDMVVYAAKPQMLDDVQARFSQAVNQLSAGGNPIQSNCLVSVAAGVTTEVLRKAFSPIVQCVRVMPNTPSLVNSGVSGMYSSKATSDLEQQNIDRVQAIFESVGSVVSVDEESHMDIVTAVAGSGPAYFYLLAEFMVEGAKKQGMSESQARQLVEQTLTGSGTLLASQQDSVQELRKKVTSPGGTTAAAMEHLITQDLQTIVEGAVSKATERGRELSSQWVES